MKQILNIKGKITVADVPAPTANDKEILVQVCYSSISRGTELSILENATKPLHKKLLERSEYITKALNHLKSQGLRNTFNQVKNNLNAFQVLGYSAAGIVVEVGKTITDIQKGDRVACAGGGIAVHAEFISIPRNLIVKVPDEIPLDLAATTTIGSIALQALRRTDAKIGEFVAIFGLGILGQLVAQMFKANGCKVIGIDINEKRIRQAHSLGIDQTLLAANDDVIQKIWQFSHGSGVDAAVITASSESHEIISQAMKVCRKKGKVVIVGDIGLNLNRNDFYRKELDVLISTSYGPGRYDENYEIEGNDYPYAYVRWTENRNMSAYLDLLNQRQINIRALIEKIYPVEQAEEAYKELKEATDPPLISLFEYKGQATVEHKVILSQKKFLDNKIKVALIGAGQFAKNIHLPNLKKLEKIFYIYAIASKTGSNAQYIAQQYGANYATTDYQDVIQDKNVDLVLISTRHAEHASLAVAAAKAGKAIFLEKPMAINEGQLEELIQTLQETNVPFTVGFNRRYSPHIKKIKEITQDRLNPMIITYRMNAGYIPKDHWVQREGGRNIGEACHIYDLFNYLVDSQIGEIEAYAINPKTSQYKGNDNFVAMIKYKDGSVCNLIYTALGSPKVPKETLDIYVDGTVISLNNFQELKINAVPIKNLLHSTPNKGLYEELVEFHQSLKTSSGYPIPLWQLIQATEISFIVERKLT